MSVYERKKSKDCNNKKVFVHKMMRGREAYYDMCVNCKSKSNCMKHSILLSLLYELGLKTVVWECPDFKE